MKRQRDNIEKVVKKPRASTPSDESEELHDPGDDDSGPEDENENQEIPRLYHILGFTVEHATYDKINEDTVYATASGTVQVAVRKGTEMSEVVDQLSREFGAEEGDNGAGGRSPEVMALMNEVPEAVEFLYRSHTPLELEPRADHQGNPLDSGRVYRRNIRRPQSELRRIRASLDASHFRGDLAFSAELPNILGEKKLSVAWTPSRRGGRTKRFGRRLPSLLELSMKELVRNAEAIVSLEGVPFILRKRLADMIGSSWGMDAKALDLFVRGSPTEICIQECSWLTQENISTAFRNIDWNNLVVLQLEQCEQCNFDYLVGQTVSKPLNSLRNLAILSLKGASRLTDNAVKALVIAAPALQSINLSQCSLLTKEGINFIADAVGPTLKELYIDECKRINATLTGTTLLKFKSLEVLSVAGIPTVYDILVKGLASVCGKTLKELNLADCQRVTNHSIQAIARTCPNLQALNISNLHQLTDRSLEYLANGCQSIQSLTLNGNRFSDEAIADFLKTSGMSMKHLSLNNVSKVGYYTAMSLASHSKGLLSLDVSWCRGVSDEGLGLIVDCCSSLRLLKLIECTQITDVFLNGHSNTKVQIVGPTNTPLRVHMNDLKPEELLLRYSDLKYKEI